MVKTRITGIITSAVVLMVITGTLGAASASADWFVNGAKLTGSAALTTSGVVDGPSTLLVPAMNLTAVCSGTSVSGANPEVIAGNTIKVKALTFNNCNVTNPPSGCSLAEKNQTVSSFPVIARAFLGPGEETRALISPQTKNLFGEVAFSEGNTCAFAGTEPVKGSFISASPSGQLEGIAESIVGIGSTENNSLEIGTGNKAFIDGGRGLLQLASGSKWSFK